MAARITKGYWIWGQFDIATTNDITALYEKIKLKLNGHASKPYLCPNLKTRDTYYGFGSTPFRATAS